ncbi:unnamed protein product [Heligmosomoides polygyrus]|uniref:WD_REPEATS_REGION domain-containing protein n=1 Tax=Heligmosomoides polygyrus TaxID=6339 RepID=A0A183GGT7_HELPZ|nr:unnamed protein product [Heligmosomoides polygyrus]
MLIRELLSRFVEALESLVIGVSSALNLCCGAHFANYLENSDFVPLKRKRHSFEAIRLNVGLSGGRRRFPNATGCGEIGMREERHKCLFNKKQKAGVFQILGCTDVVSFSDKYFLSGQVEDLPVSVQMCVVRTFTGHTQGITCVQFDDDRIVSGSSDTTIRIWDLRNSSDVGSELIGHNDAVLCVQYRDRESLAVSGSADNSIKCWDTRTGRPEMTIHNAHDNAVCTMYFMYYVKVTCVRFDDHRIVSGSVDRMIKMWDVRTGKCMHTIDWKLAEGHTGVVRCLQVDTWRIVWNVDSLQRLCTLHSHEDGVTCVQFSDRQIVSGSYDKTVKLWDFSRC